MATHMTPKQQREYRQRRKAEGRPLPGGGHEDTAKKAKRMKVYRQRPAVRARDTRRAIAKRTMRPEQYAAWLAVGNAILRGDLVRQPCETRACGRKADAHHEDYSKPLEVRWLCRGCHMRTHKEARP